MNGTVGNPNLPPTIMENGDSEMNDSMDQKKSEENFGPPAEEDEEDDVSPHEHALKFLPPLKTLINY